MEVAVAFPPLPPEEFEPPDAVVEPPLGTMPPYPFAHATASTLSVEARSMLAVALPAAPPFPVFWPPLPAVAITVPVVCE